MENPFVLNKEEYKRDIDPIGHYVLQAKHYLSRSTGASLQECEEYLKKQISAGGKFEFKDPVIKHTERIEYKDRIETESTVLSYIKDAIKNDHLIAPTLTTYVNPKEKESLLTQFTDDNTALRNVAKRKMFDSQMSEIRVTKRINQLKLENKEEKELVKQQLFFRKDKIINKSVQGNKKTSNNSLSGAQVSASTPLYNKTAHSTLTSVCRITSGYGNLNNEKFVSGNRHYHSFEITLNNIVSIVTNTDYDAINNVMTTFGIRAPNVEETMQCIRYSSMMYWREQAKLSIIEEYISKLDDLERAAVVYTGDFYHLMRYNDSVVRTFLGKLATKVDLSHPNPIYVLKSTREDIHHLAAQICNKEMMGVKISDAFEVKKNDNDEYILDEAGNKILVDPYRAGVMASTIENIQNTLVEYTPFIKAFWVTNNIPASVAYLPNMVRRVTLISDTDSAIFTVQGWIKWYFGNVKFTDESLGMCATLVFLTAQTITHILAKMSANLGISTQRIHQIKMKNEFRFDILTPTQIGKHYYALIGCQEGNLFDKYGVEIKGVHLKSSNAPKKIIDAAHDLIENGIMKAIIRGESISLDKIIRDVVSIEKEIITSIKAGNHDYLRLAQIKEAESYTKEEHQSPYQHYLMWEEVFAPKYGHVPPPPYVAIKISITLNSKRRMDQWLVGLEDQELAERMRLWLDKNGKKNGIGTFQLPDQILSSIGFPEEIFKALDMRRIILDATGVFYIILETIGFFMLNKKRTKLISDYY